MKTCIEQIAHIENDFPTKFGIPRQSGLVSGLVSTIVFEDKYRVPEALRGINEFSHLWLIWGFSAAERKSWSPTVRPPRLGGNTRIGVFASRSPFRPNSLGLSSVRLIDVTSTAQGTVLRVTGADLMNGTPIYDIKPYLSFTDSHADAIDGYAGKHYDFSLDVVIPDSIPLPPELIAPLRAILAQDPRPSYHDDSERIYGFVYAGYEIRFTVADSVLTVCSAEISPTLI